MYTADMDANMVGIIPMPTASDKDIFFQDIRELEAIVKDSLMVYLAYELKAQDASKYLADPSGNYPLLEKEAKLRKVTVEQLAKLVLEKAEGFKYVVRTAELLRNEFNLVYSTLDKYEDKVALRDRLLGEFRKLTEALN